MEYGLASEPIGKQDSNPDPAKHRPRHWRLCFSRLYAARAVADAGDRPICDAACFVATDYEGQNYCVPRDGAANTKRILGLLTQIVALNTAIEDVPVAPTVRAIP